MYLIVYKLNHDDGSYTEKRLNLSIAHDADYVLQKFHQISSRQECSDVRLYSDWNMPI